MAGQELIQNTSLLELCSINSEDDVLNARMAVKLHSKDLQFSLVNQTKLMTAASELARNVLEHGQGGDLRIESIATADETGVRLTFSDKGPGIENIEVALTDGFTSKNGMGLGLSGSKRLMDEFEIQSEPGRGTTVVVTKWK